MTTIIITGVERADVGAVDNVELLGEVKVEFDGDSIDAVGNELFLRSFVFPFP